MKGPFSDLFGKEGSAVLRRLRLPESRPRALEDLLEQLDLLARQAKRVRDHLAKRSLESDAVRRRMTMPGVDHYAALVLLSEIGDVTRFPDAKRLCSYAGLLPRVAQSGDVTRRGGIHKQGPKRLRWIMVAGAHAAVKARNGKGRRVYARLSRRVGAGKAIVAVARRMLAVVFALLTQGTEYAEKDARAHGRKVRAMALRARELPRAKVAERLDQLSPEAMETLMREVEVPG